MATITKHRGKWKAIIRLKGWPTTAKSFQRKRDAQEWANQTELDMRRGRYIERSHAEGTTLKTAMDRYLEEVSSTKAATTTHRERLRSKPLLDHLGKYSLAAITPDVVAKYRDKRLKTQSRLGKPIGENSVRLELALLSHLFTTAIQEWRLGLTYNPVAAIRKPSPPKGRDRRLSKDEEKRLLEAADAWSNPFMGWIIRLALETAMRHSEILELRRYQVDLVKRIIHLPKTKNGEARDVPLSVEAERVICAALDHPAKPDDTDLIFWGNPGRKDGKRRPYVITRNWQEIRAGVGMADLHFHDLRHEATSRLVEQGLSDQEVAAITGHKSMQMLLMSFTMGRVKRWK